MTVIRLASPDEEAIDFLIPEDQAQEIGSADEVTYKGRSYRFASVRGRRLTFCPSGPTVALKEEWRRD